MKSITFSSSHIKGKHHHEKSMALQFFTYLENNGSACASGGPAGG
ncbi:hypothetical protein [Desulfoluna limicola]|nr:hypothetical protein [Desulfoluna limicola]